MRQLFSPPRRPYYIDAPAYRRTSAGIRVMHLLCHALNSIGEEAYVYPTETNPTLNTPLVTPEISARHKAAGREPIVIYPEVVPGNPRRAASVVPPLEVTRSRSVAARTGSSWAFRVA